MDEFKFQAAEIYLTDLAGLSIACPLLLVNTLLGKANAEHSQCITVSSFNINMSLNQ